MTRLSLFSHEKAHNAQKKKEYNMIKACKTIVDEHVAQLLGHLRATNIEDGLLIHFGAPKLRIKKYVLSK